MAANTNRLKSGLKLLQKYSPQIIAALSSAKAKQHGAAPAPQAPSPGKPQPPPGRKATTASSTASRARHIEYSPSLDGDADPGEIVWTWVAYEEDASQGKDRPVLVVGRDGVEVLGLMLSSNERRAEDPDWVGIGSGPWDREGRPSWVRLDRILAIDADGIRREGSIMPERSFNRVVDRLRSQYGWT